MQFFIRVFQILHFTGWSTTNSKKKYSWNTQIYVITQGKNFTYLCHRNIYFHFKVSENIFNRMLCLEMLDFQKKPFWPLEYQSTENWKTAPNVSSLDQMPIKVNFTADILVAIKQLPFIKILYFWVQNVFLWKWNMRNFSYVITHICVLFTVNLVVDHPVCIAIWPEWFENHKYYNKQWLFKKSICNHLLKSTLKIAQDNFIEVHRPRFFGFLYL